MFYKVESLSCRDWPDDLLDSSSDDLVELLFEARIGFRVIQNFNANESSALNASKGVS